MPELQLLSNGSFQVMLTKPGHGRCCWKVTPTRSSTSAWQHRSSTAAARLRADAGVIEKNRRGHSGLWGFAISGDLPIVLLQLAGPQQSAVTGQMVRAHPYWTAFVGLRNELADPFRALNRQ